MFFSSNSPSLCPSILAALRPKASRGLPWRLRGRASAGQWALRIWKASNRGAWARCLGGREGGVRWARWAGCVAAEFWFPAPDSSRRGMSWIFCRKSAARPEPRSAQEPPGLAPFWRLFRFSASVDHQMTPALFRPLFRASPSRGLHWRTGCRARLRRPSDLKHHAASREGCGLGASVGQRPPSPVRASN